MLHRTCRDTDDTNSASLRHRDNTDAVYLDLLVDATAVASTENTLAEEMIMSMTLSAFVASQASPQLRVWRKGGPYQLPHPARGDHSASRDERPARSRTASSPAEPYQEP